MPPASGGGPGPDLCPRPRGYALLRVELDDQLLLDRGVDGTALREGVDEDPHGGEMTSSQAGVERLPAGSRAMTNGVISRLFGRISTMSFAETR